MRHPLRLLEALLLLVCAMLLALAVFGPAFAEPAHHYDFADQRALWPTGVRPQPQASHGKLRGLARDLGL